MEEKLKNLTMGQAAIAGVVIAVLYFFSLYDNGESLEVSINNTRSQITANNAEMQNVLAAIEDAQRYEKTKASLGLEMDRVLRAIPQKLNSIDLMKIMSNEAKSVGAEITSINAPQGFRQSTTPEQASQLYEPMPISITIGGSYNQVMQFLSNLTRLDKIFTVSQMQLSVKSTTGKAGGPPNMVMAATFNAYKYKDAAAGGGK